MSRKADQSKMLPFSAERTEQPLFERFDRDNASQLQSVLANMQALHQQVATLERINLDLESRLEGQAKERIEVEHECAEIDSRWREKYNKLEKQMDQLRVQIHKHQQQNDRLREHLARTERELHGILQKKYQFRRSQQQQQQQQGGAGASSTSAQPPSGLRRGWGFSRDVKKTSVTEDDIAPLAQKSSLPNIRKAMLDEMAEAANGGLLEENVDDLSTDMAYATKSSHAHEVRQARAFASLTDFFGL